MRPYLAGFFDTNSGPKTSPASYKEIALSIGADAPADLLFATGEQRAVRSWPCVGLRTHLLFATGERGFATGAHSPAVCHR